MNIKFRTLTLAITLMLATNIFSQKSYNCTKITNEKINIDGVLNEPIWQNGNWQSGFTQKTPNEGELPSQKTYFKIFYDNNYLYIAIKANDTKPTKIERQLTRRDNIDGDYITIDFDSYHDKQTAYSFTLSASGVKQDKAISENGNYSDKNWNPIWYGKTSINNKGWIAEIKIPFTQLRFNKIKEQIWGLNITRFIYRNSETDQWQLISKEASGFVSEFGELKGINNIKPKKEASITPFAVSTIEKFKKEIENPYSKTGNRFNYNGGVNAKFGISNGVTLNLAINPDFGQVEGDPSEVNLTAFETYYSEKRPFFVAGSDIFRFRLMKMGDFMADNLFYSRRIGRKQHYYPSLNSNEYAENPTNTTILGAAKLSGKTKNGWTIGVLESVTQDEYAKITDSTHEYLTNVEPLTNYFVGRVQKDYNNGNTRIGGMLTSTNRKIDNEQLNYLHSQAYTGGFNIDHQWDNKNYILSLRSIFSNVVGSKEAIKNTQNSSAHYFNRPDASHLKYDTTRTSLTGTGASFMFGKIGKGKILYAMFINYKSPKLELNDIGYQQDADQLSQLAWMQYRILKPNIIFRQFKINFNQWYSTDFGGKKLSMGGNYNFGATFNNLWSLYFGSNINGSHYSRTALFGGPYMRTEPTLNHWISINSNSQKKLTVSFGGSTYKNSNNTSNSKRLWISASYKPLKTLNISVNPSYSKSTNSLRYVDVFTYQNSSKYILAKLSQTTLNMSIRINLSLTPNLSIQYWGQPFASLIQYSNYKILTNPTALKYEDRFHEFTEDEITYNPNTESFDIDLDNNNTIDYTLSKPDYHVVELISNFVLRWEYKPGSTIYFVWTQNRFNTPNNFSSNITDNINDISRIFPNNTILLKATYRFSLN